MVMLNIAKVATVLPNTVCLRLSSSPALSLSVLLLLVVCVSPPLDPFRFEDPCVDWMVGIGCCFWVSVFNSQFLGNLFLVVFFSPRYSLLHGPLLLQLGCCEPRHQAFSQGVRCSIMVTRGEGRGWSTVDIRVLFHTFIQQSGATRQLMARTSPDSGNLTFPALYLGVFLSYFFRLHCWIWR